MSHPHSKAISRLLAGYERFHNEQYGTDRKLVPALAEDQHPNVLVIGCCDSRVDPALILDAESGDIFVLRSIANIVPVFDEGDTQHLHTCAAVEFAVNSLMVQEIVVLGHSGCAGIRAVIGTLLGDPLDGMPNVSKWLEGVLKPCREVLAVASEKGNTDKETIATEAEQQVLLNSLANLVAYPAVQGVLERDSLRLHGW